MSDIEELQQRISAAMERVAGGLENLGKADTSEADALKQALEEERTVSAQLEERLRALKDRQAQELATAQAQAAESGEKVAALDLELQRLRGANDKLREANAALREANAAGLGDATLINGGLQAEVDALKAARAADMAEANAILTALTPLLQPDAAAGEEGTHA